MNSWVKSDSHFFQDVLITHDWDHIVFTRPWPDNILALENPNIGPDDMRLAKSLIKAGPEHRKFMRQIMIWVDFSLPRYVWTELDTYKVSTVRNSCSTMHKLGSRDLETEDFQLVQPPDKYPELQVLFEDTFQKVLEFLNIAGKKYRETQDFNVVRSMKCLNPEGLIQKATYTMSYETAFSMYQQRERHRLPEWSKVNLDDGQSLDLQPSVFTSICDWIYQLPYMKEFLNKG